MIITGEGPGGHPDGAERGWYLVRQKGSHRQYHHPTSSGTVTVAGNPGLDMHKGTVNSVKRQAGIR
jgi:predicted RNA binding protein YcfA (HicA-like mRNA interferase family)